MSRARTLADQFNSDGDLALTPVASVNAGQIGGRRNLITNGAMEVAQRGTSFSLTSTEQYTLDRFIGTSYGGNTVTFSQSSDVPASGTFFNSIKAENSGSTAVGASGFYSFRQKIEGFVLRPLRMGQANAKSFTVSFWVKSSIAPATHTVGLINGALNRSNRSEFTINAANTWEYKSVTFAGDTTGTWATDNTNAMYLDIVIAHGSGNVNTADTWTADSTEGTTGTDNTWPSTNGATFYATGLQLELGSQASDFEHRSYGEELALCQRYYQKIIGTYGSTQGLGTGFGSNNTLTTVDIFPPVKSLLRNQSSISFSAASGFTINTNAIADSCSSVSAATYSNNHVRAQFTCNSADSGTTSGPRLVRMSGVGTYIAWDSEL